MGLTRITAPGAEAVTLADVKAHLYLRDTREDALLMLYIRAATEYVERTLNRALITQTWDWTIDAFPRGVESLQLPLPPLQSVASVKYIDMAGVEQTWASSEYAVYTTSEPGWITPANLKVWPVALNVFDAVTIRFQAGYGLGHAAIPARLRTSLCGLVANYYTNRDSAGSVPMWVADLLADFLVMV